MNLTFFFRYSIFAVLSCAILSAVQGAVPFQDEAESRFWFSKGCKGEGNWVLTNTDPSKPDCSPPKCEDESIPCDYRKEKKTEFVCTDIYGAPIITKAGPFILGGCPIGAKREPHNFHRYVCKVPNCSPSPSPSVTPSPSATSSPSASPSPSATSSPSTTPSPSGEGSMRYLEEKKKFGENRYPLAVFLALEERDNLV